MKELHRRRLQEENFYKAEALKSFLSCLPSIYHLLCDMSNSFILQTSIWLF